SLIPASARLHESESAPTALQNVEGEGSYHLIVAGHFESINHRVTPEIRRAQIFSQGVGFVWIHESSIDGRRDDFFGDPSGSPPLLLVRLATSMTIGRPTVTCRIHRLGHVLS